jgi:hypothetical protein
MAPRGAAVTPCRGGEREWLAWRRAVGAIDEQIGKIRWGLRVVAVRGAWGVSLWREGRACVRDVEAFSSPAPGLDFGRGFGFGLDFGLDHEPTFVVGLQFKKTFFLELVIQNAGFKS